MASGPPKFGDNRFAMLSDSPKKKRKDLLLNFKKSSPNFLKKQKKTPNSSLYLPKIPRRKFQNTPASLFTAR